MRALVIDDDSKLQELLREYLQQVHGIAVSQKSVRLAIERLRMSWKRPRHQLSLRPEHWRQSKGG